MTRGPKRHTYRRQHFLVFVRVGESGAHHSQLHWYGELEGAGRGVPGEQTDPILSAGSCFEDGAA